MRLQAGTDWDYINNALLRDVILQAPVTQYQALDVRLGE